LTPGTLRIFLSVSRTIGHPIAREYHSHHPTVIDRMEWLSRNYKNYGSTITGSLYFIKDTMTGSRDSEGGRFFDPFLIVKAIHQMPSREIVNPSMNVHVRLGDRLKFLEIIGLPFHALPHNGGYGPFALRQILDEVNERLEPAVDRTLFRFVGSVTDSDGVFNTSTFRAPNDGYWKAKLFHRRLYLGNESRLAVL